MPRYSKKRGGYRKRYNRRRKRFGGKNNKRSVLAKVRGVSRIPDRLLARLRYVEPAVVLLNNQAVNSLQYRGSSAYDPNTLSGGHSAYCFDQWAALYQRYRVHSCEIRLKNAYCSGGFRVAVCPVDSLGWLPTNLSSMMEQPYVKWLDIPSIQNDKNSLSLKMYSRKVFGVKSILYDSDLFSALTNAIPTRNWYWFILATSFDTVTVESARMDIDIIYNIEFFDRRPLQGSGITTKPQGEVGSSNIGPTGITYNTGVTGPDFIPPII